MNLWNTRRAQSVLDQLRIEDLPAFGEELSEDDLRLVAGGITITITGSPTGAGTCTFNDDFDMAADS